MVEVKWLSISSGRDVSFNTGVVAAIAASLYDLAKDLVKIGASPLETYAALKELFSSEDVLGTLSEALKQSYIERIAQVEEEYQRAGASGAFNAGLEGGKLLLDVVGLISGVAGAGRGGVAYWRIYRETFSCDF